MTFEEWWNDWMGMNVPKTELYEIAKDAWDEATLQVVNSKLTPDDDLTIAYMKGYSDGKEAISKMETPNGYVLVPVEPTEKMINAGDVLWDHHCTSIYEAMIHAAQESE